MLDIEQHARFDLSEPTRGVVYACSDSCAVRIVADGIFVKQVTLSPFSVGYVFAHGSYRTVYSGLTTRVALSPGVLYKSGRGLGRTFEQDLFFQVYHILPSGEIEELNAREWLR